MDMDIFLQIIVTGIATGGVYGLIALGFVLIFQDAASGVCDRLDVFAEGTICIDIEFFKLALHKARISFGEGRRTESESF